MQIRMAISTGMLELDNGLGSKICIILNGEETHHVNFYYIREEATQECVFTSSILLIIHSLISASLSTMQLKSKLAVVPKEPG